MQEGKRIIHSSTKNITEHTLVKIKFILKNYVTECTVYYSNFNNTQNCKVYAFITVV